MLPVPAHVGGAVLSGVVDGVEAGFETGVADADDDAAGPDGSGVVLGAGLADDAQAATSSPTTNGAATRESEERIGCPPVGVQAETFGGYPLWLRPIRSRSDGHLIRHPCSLKGAALRWIRAG
jgi:hypothetical protein